MLPLQKASLMEITGLATARNQEALGHCSWNTVMQTYALGIALESLKYYEIVVFDELRSFSDRGIIISDRYPQP
jgi:hypothetical protein